MIGEDFPNFENFDDYKLPWRGRAVKRADGFFHFTICNDRLNLHDKGRRLSFDLDENGAM